MTLEFAPSLRERFAALPVKLLLVEQRHYWHQPDLLTKDCPSAFVAASWPLGVAIDQKLVHETLVSRHRPLLGDITRAGLPQAHLLLDPCRWPPSAAPGWAPVYRALTALHYADATGQAIWERAAFEQDPPALARLQAILRGED
jgi:hypothetical protein